MLPSRLRTGSAPRNSTRFAARYPACGLPCERFKLSLAASPCITRGRGGWLGLTPRKTCTSYPLPASLAHSELGQGTKSLARQPADGGRRACRRRAGYGAAPKHGGARFVRPSVRCAHAGPVDTNFCRRRAKGPSSVAHNTMILHPLLGGRNNRTLSKQSQSAQNVSRPPLLVQIRGIG
jgi:hypothetical protein